MNRNKADLTKTISYDYHLPEEQIAQNPVEPRDASRLLVLHANENPQKIEHRFFSDVSEYLKEGDLLVLNDTKVLPARLEGRKKNGGAHVEIFCLRPLSGEKGEWSALVRPGRKLPEGTEVLLSEEVSVTVGERLEDGLRVISFSSGHSALELMRSFGKTPLPHYITSSSAKPERYQTVYASAQQENSVAAPTAGLHFTPELLASLKEKGIEQAYVTLQVGLGTFRQVKAENIGDHIMHSELCEIPELTAEAINRTKSAGGRVVAVGTTVVRTLESSAAKFGQITPCTMDTSLFISPGFNFSVVDVLITNFHLPKSTLLMLVTAFGGYDEVMAAYQCAVREKYRFFSFGDSMLIL